ncbi:SpoIIE family protein phosphatase [Actinomadura macrotermitis]|uniref:GAF domain-containing protein n=1 Tax=Actinomadura macrotermitis TaxID=2585200 RepID=A0A7K0C2R6_9ACTN|nr:SpoIIE family protein phosphatase [Actinomadura macrotermitis]MQY07720.1 hypothetical protein [Actinomadura macrotermitis]
MSVGAWPPATRADEGFGSSPGRSTAVFALLSGPEHRLETANPAFFETVGAADRVRSGLPLAQVLPELAEQGFVAVLDEVYRTGRPRTSRDSRVLLGRGRRAREAFFDLTYEPRLDAAGGVVGVAVFGVETTGIRHAQLLAAEQHALLEQIARQAPLEQTLDGMARVIEKLSPGALASVLLADADGRHLRHGAAPSLPRFYTDAIDGIATGEAAGACGTAAHRRRTVVAADIAADPFWDGYHELAARAGLASCWSTPILGGDGRLLGTFAIYHRVARTPQVSDFGLCDLFAGIAALAIERHLGEQARTAAVAKEKAARADLAFLLGAGSVLAQNLDHTETLQRLADLCVPALAPLCTVDVVEDGQVCRVAIAAATVREQRLLAAHPPDTGAMVGRVLAGGGTEVARHAPADLWGGLGITDRLCVPLTDRGAAFGALTLLTGGGRPLEDRVVSLAEELARRAAMAARNARQYAQRAQLAHDLQAGLLLPDLPALPGAGLATHYHPAGEGLEIGGDFYDVFPLAGRTCWAFMIGDVCGRGAVAATTTALVRHTARAVARLLPGPAEVVQAVNTALLERPGNLGGGFVTLVYGHLAREDDRLTVELVRAGHVLPRLLGPGGAVTQIDAEGALLGLMDDPGVEPCRLELRPGQSLVLVTDGITEARSAAGAMFNDEGLDGALAAVPPNADAAAVLDTLTAAVRAFTGPAAVDDDQAALVLTALSK